MNEFEKKLKHQNITEKSNQYKEAFGKNAVYEAVKDQDNEKYFGKEDILELMFYEDGVAKHIKVVGDIKKYADYIIAKVNQDSEVLFTTTIDKKRKPYVKVDKGEFL